MDQQIRPKFRTETWPEQIRCHKQRVWTDTQPNDKCRTKRQIKADSLNWDPKTECKQTVPKFRLQSLRTGGKHWKQAAFLVMFVWFVEMAVAGELLWNYCYFSNYQQDFLLCWFVFVDIEAEEYFVIRKGFTVFYEYSSLKNLSVNGRVCIYKSVPSIVPNAYDDNLIETEIKDEKLSQKIGASGNCVAEYKIRPNNAIDLIAAENRGNSN